ncbi:MAG: hypothetical protein ACOYNL_04275 [Rickettsiales bacterium]
MQGDMIFYVLVLVIVTANVVASTIINRKRVKLDLTNPVDAKKDKSLRLVMLSVLIQSLIAAALLLLVVKPMTMAA